MLSLHRDKKFGGREPGREMGRSFSVHRQDDNVAVFVIIGGIGNLLILMLICTLRSFISSAVK